MTEFGAQQFGFDCGESVTFSNWKPGGEYTRVLTIKNISTATQTISYIPSNNPLFFLPYPLPIMLSAGMSQQVTVVYRPLELIPQNEIIVFNCAKGTFTIPLIATVPLLIISVPQYLDFDLCPVNEVTTITFNVVNVGQLNAPFNFIIPDDNETLKLEPMNGEVLPGKWQTIKAHFKPIDASVLQLNVTCSCPSKDHIITFHAFGKYPYLKTSQNEIDFGEVIVGSTTTKKFVLSNNSSVFSSFNVISLDVDRKDAPVFRFSPQSGRLKPGESIAIGVTLTAVTHNMHAKDKFQITTPGANKIEMTCITTMAGPTVVLDRSIVNFGSLEIGQSAKKIFVLTNQSNAPANFQMVADTEGFFGMNCTGGTLPAVTAAHNSREVEVTFAPLVCMNHHKQLLIMIGNQAPLAIDLMGTGFTERARPAPFHSKYLVKYQQAVRDAPGRSEVEALINLQEEEEQQKLIKSRRQSISTSQLEEGGQEQANGSPNMSGSGLMEIQGEESEIEAGFPVTPSRPDPLLWEKVFYDEGDDNIPIVIVPPLCVFTNGIYRVPGEQQIVTLHNRTIHKICSVWRRPPPGRMASFTVEPNTIDIPAHSSAQFTVTFQPMKRNTYYSKHLEVMCYVKYLRMYTLSEGRTKVPPWCLTLRVVGRCFEAVDAQGFIPVGSLSPPVLELAPTTQGVPAYHTMQISNNGDTTLLFEASDDTSGRFFVSPHAGSIKPRSFSLVSVSFFPPPSYILDNTLNKKNIQNIGNLRSMGKGTQKRRKRNIQVDDERDEKIEILHPGGWKTYDVHKPIDMHSFRLKAYPNNEVTMSYESTVLATVHHPGISFDQKQLVLRSTCIGTRSERIFPVRNPSRTTIIVSVTLDKGDKRSCCISPTDFVLTGNNSMPLKVVFSPRTLGEHIFRARIESRFPKKGEDLSLIGKQTNNAYGDYQNPNKPNYEIEDEDEEDESELGKENITAFMGIIGLGITGQIRFEPSDVDYDIQMTSHTREKTVALINDSDADVCYHLEVNWESVSDSSLKHTTIDTKINEVDDNQDEYEQGENQNQNLTNQNINKSDVNVKFSNAGSEANSIKGLKSEKGKGKKQKNKNKKKQKTITQKFQLINSDDDNEDDNDDGFNTPQPVLSVSPQSGTIPARSHESIKLLFRPLMRAMYTCTISCVIEQEHKNVVSNENENENEDNIVLMKPTCIATGLGILPSAAVVDAYKVGMEKVALWKELSLDQVNEAFSKELSPADAEFNTYDGLLYTERGVELLGRLMHLPFFLGVAPIDSQPTQVFLCVQNNGRLPLDWRIRNPTDYDVRADNWVEERDLAAPASLIQQMQGLTGTGYPGVIGTTGTATTNKVESGDSGDGNDGSGGQGNANGQSARRQGNNGSVAKSFKQQQSPFNIEPREGHLEVGEECVVTFTLNHGVHGVHAQSYIWQLLGGGKQIVLQVSGITHTKQEPYLTFAQGEKIHMLTSSPLGEMDPAIQGLILRNDGSVPAEFHLDLSEIDQMNAAAYDFPLFEVSRTSGVVPPNGGIDILRWKFRPLLPKGYYVNLPIAVNGVPNALQALLACEGYIPRGIPYALNNDKSVAAPLTPLPYQICLISHQYLSFGRLPAFAVERRLVVLVVPRGTGVGSVRFDWEAPEALVKYNILNFYPKCGELQEGGRQICVVELRCGHIPSVVDVAARCVVKAIQRDGQDILTPALLASQIGLVGSGMNIRRNAGQQLPPINSDSRGVLRPGAMYGQQVLNIPGQSQQGQQNVFRELPGQSNLSNSTNMNSQNVYSPLRGNLGIQAFPRQSVIERITTSRAVAIANTLEEHKEVLKHRRAEEEMFLQALAATPGEVLSTAAQQALRPNVIIGPTNPTARNAVEKANIAQQTKSSAAIIQQMQNQFYKEAGIPGNEQAFDNGTIQKGKSGTPRQGAKQGGTLNQNNQNNPQYTSQPQQQNGQTLKQQNRGQKNLNAIQLANTVSSISSQQQNIQLADNQQQPLSQTLYLRITYQIFGEGRFELLHGSPAQFFHSMPGLPKQNTNASPTPQTSVTPNQSNPPSVSKNLQQQQQQQQSNLTASSALLNPLERVRQNQDQFNIFKAAAQELLEELTQEIVADPVFTNLAYHNVSNKRPCHFAAFSTTRIYPTPPTRLVHIKFADPLPLPIPPTIPSQTKQSNQQPTIIPPPISSKSVPNDPTSLGLRTVLTNVDSLALRDAAEDVVEATIRCAISKLIQDELDIAV